MSLDHAITEFLITVTSGVELCLGAITILSYCSDTYPSYCMVFFLISGLFMSYLLVIARKRAAPNDTSYVSSPLFSNLVTFLVFGLLQQGSVCFILHTLFVCLDFFGKYFKGNNDLAQSIQGICSSKPMSIFMAWLAVLAMPEMFIEFLYIRSWRVLLAISTYVVFVLMYGYRVSNTHAEIWKNLYQWLVGVVNGLNGKPKQIGEYLLGQLAGIPKMAGRLFPRARRT